VGGEEQVQDAGFRIQVTGKGGNSIVNYELWIVSSLLTSGHRRLPSAYCLLPTAHCTWGEFELAGILARTAVCYTMSPWLRKKKR
jgi:hypothetical protein